MVARLVHERIGIIPTTLDQPETVVARGALLAVPETRRPVETERTVRTPPQLPPPPPQYFSMPLPPPPPPQPPPRRRKVGWIVGALLVAAVAVTLVVVLNSGSSEPAGRTIAQFDYQFTLPEDWTQVSSNTDFREVRVKPVGAEGGNDLIVVQELALTFDASAERDRAVGDLRSKYEQSTTLRLSDLKENDTFAGREVVSYRQRIDTGTVEWFVLFERHAQVSIGCQHTDAGRDRVMGACDTVVRTMKVN
jgi:type VII secretion-associated protein (TIGR03931 family)